MAKNPAAAPKKGRGKNDSEADKIMASDIDRYYKEGWDVKRLAAVEEQEKLAAKRGRRAA